ncbi:SDR family NAD(P)-dependent oxidoreductase [Paracoccus benzoatiresistens]|uniref:SDR family oxidoreductase n=1 Tax=Paracoccus benzoatiresistens TaxID=2997341 RepID=A0ABT4JAT0_9RHOB|nr:SDR family oxidoreductase [Paracoccus sp. EF6]MCZ0964237.1 SDR family oxidoreductase [Paracoccus sp. EF6]
MTPDFSVKDRIACVTGASSGLGKAISEALVQGGARVVCLSRRSPDWCDGKTAAAISADLSDTSVTPDIAARVAKVFGPPDILINAAGINIRQHADDVTPEGWQATLALNLTVPFFLAQAMVPAMRDKGWGRIVNFASLQSQRAFAAGIAYGASKGGIAQLTRAMAEAWSRHGITANALAPGFFPTELTSPVFSNPELSTRNAAQTCIGRNGTMADILGPALFLCAPASDYVTGQVLYVDGGFTAK